MLFENAMRQEKHTHTHERHHVMPVELKVAAESVVLGAHVAPTSRMQDKHQASCTKCPASLA